MLHKVRWAPQKLAQRLELIAPLVHWKKDLLPAFKYTTLASPQVAPPVGDDVNTADWQTIPYKTYWGTWMTDFAMRSQFTVPADWSSEFPVALFLPLGDAGDFSHPETLAYIDGVPYAAADRHHQEFRLAESYRDGKTHHLMLHGWTGLGGFAQSDPDVKLYMRECYVVQIHQPTRDFIAMARMALEVAKQLDDNDPVKGRLYNALEDAFKTLDTRDPLGTPAFYDSVPAAIQALKAGLDISGAPMDVDIIAVGHAHIDVAWLWTLGQTVRKSGRTFSTVLRLMEQFPDYKFSQSQAQLYAYTEKHYPDIFAQIKERVKEGRWEVMGGTWVEPDCNAIGAESLARQFLLGRTYFRKHFGDVDTPVLWLPDTFGYSWALPQLIKEAGMKYFITHKMSWNQYNQMPNQMLWWQGLDGTRVLTFFLTTPQGWEFLPYATTYNGLVNGDEVFGTWRIFRQKETHNELITAYGYGDGGGGPTREMIENIHNLEQHPGAPRLRTGTIAEFMDRLDREVSHKLPTWNGEFYFEYHRGTYTGQARNKRNNRKSEFLMHDTEFVASWAMVETKPYHYPADKVNLAWELICLNQFHDILPGSSIGPVYADSDLDYQRIYKLGEEVRYDALEAIERMLTDKMTVMVVNPTSFGGKRVGFMPAAVAGGLVDLRTNQHVLVQTVEGGTLVVVPDLNPYSMVALRDDFNHTATDDSLTITEAAGLIVLENPLVRVELNSAGDVSRVYDKTAKREVLPAGTVGNALQAFEDRPMNFDAWDIDIFFEDRTEKVEGLQSMKVIETGPVRVGVEIVRQYRSSTITQKIYLYVDSQRLDFDTHIDWHEHHILLKAAFPTTVLSPNATFDVQWGNVERPTHRNTSWDWARFETCAHKWADLSEGNFGVAVLNDCKYGYDVKDNVIRLTLLKSATSPDENADQGEHKMLYSLYPHTNDWRTSVQPAAYDLNDPIIVRRAGDGRSDGLATFTMMSVDMSSVIIETIKRAEDGNGIIVRLYESERNRGKVTLTTGFNLVGAQRVNLLEEPQHDLSVENGNQVSLDIAPYQIVSLRLLPTSQRRNIED